MVRIKSKEEVKSNGRHLGYVYEIYRPSSDQVEEELPLIPTFRKHEKHPRKHDGEIMTELLIWPLFVCYKLYYHERRQLDVEDIHKIMRMVFHGKEYSLETKLFQHMDGDNVMTTELNLQAKNQYCTEPWIPRVDLWYKELQDKDPTVKAKAEGYSGFIGRPLYDLDILHKNRRAQEDWSFRLDQHAFIYGVHHWCRDENGNRLEDHTAMGIIVNHYRLDTGRLSDNDQKLLEGRRYDKMPQYLKSVPAFVKSNENCFKPKVLEAWSKYERGRGPSGNVEAVTRSMQATTLQAFDTAPTPYQYQQGPEATGRQRRIRGSGQDPEDDTEARLRYEKEERERAEREARLQAEKEAEKEAHEQWKKDRDSYIRPPDRGPRPDLSTPYAGFQPPEPASGGQQSHPHSQGTSQPKSSPSYSSSRAEKTDSRQKEPEQKGNKESRQKKRAKPGSPGSSQSPKQKKKQGGLPYDPARNDRDNGKEK